MEFEPETLKAFLRENIGGSDADFALERIGGGQSNPTFFVTFGGARMVLRKKPAGQILSGAHAVEREYRVLKALEGTGVPAPRTIMLEQDPSILGTPFYLMDRVEGRVFSDAALPGRLTQSERRDIYFGMADAMAKLHAVDPAEVGLSDFGRPSNYFQRQIARWTKQYRESPSERIADLDQLAEWLPANMPVEENRIAIAHGDFRLGNMLFHPTSGEVIAILDWELATLGDPLADLAFAAMPWRSAPDEYGGILGLDRVALGIPSEAEFIARYYAHAVRTPPIEPFHFAFAMFRFAVIFVGIADRARAGTAASGNAADVGPLARRFAARAVEAIKC